MSNNKYGFKITNIITAVKLSVAHGYKLYFARTYFRNDADANDTILVIWNSTRPLFYMMTSSSYSYFTIIVFHQSILTFVFPLIKQRLEKI